MDVEAKDNEGRTPMHRAAGPGKDEIIRLFSHGVVQNAKITSFCSFAAFCM